MQEVLATTDLVEERDAKFMVELGEQNVDLLIGMGNTVANMDD